MAKAAILDRGIATLLPPALHSAIALEVSVVVNTFSPPRDDYDMCSPEASLASILLYQS
jgi:hypothetical protein